MPQPLDVPRHPERPLTINAPLHCIEVQIGALTARGRDGFEAQGKAGETIDGGKLHCPVELTPTESPCRVRVVYDSEARAYEAQQAQQQAKQRQRGTT
jgi:hypothetical protein